MDEIVAFTNTPFNIALRWQREIDALYGVNDLQESGNPDFLRDSTNLHDYCAAFNIDLEHVKAHASAIEQQLAIYSEYGVSPMLRTDQVEQYQLLNAKLEDFCKRKNVDLDTIQMLALEEYEIERQAYRKKHAVKLYTEMLLGRGFIDEMKVKRYCASAGLDFDDIATQGHVEFTKMLEAHTQPGNTDDVISRHLTELANLPGIKQASTPSDSSLPKRSVLGENAATAKTAPFDFAQWRANWQMQITHFMNRSGILSDFLGIGSREEQDRKLLQLRTTLKKDSMSLTDLESAIGHALDGEKDRTKDFLEGFLTDVQKLKEVKPEFNQGTESPRSSTSSVTCPPSPTEQSMYTPACSVWAAAAEAVALHKSGFTPYY